MKEKKKMVNVATVEGQSSGVSQNPNFITSVIEYENDDDDMDD
jgi:hypothetical protein